MITKRIEQDILNFLVKIEEKYSNVETFKGLLGVALNIYMDELHDEKLDPLEVMTAIINDALKYYKRNEELHFAPSQGDG